MNSLRIAFGWGNWCSNQTHIVLTSAFHNDILQRRCHTAWCRETNEISHLWHILFFTCCEIIGSNDSAGLIWWILCAVRWWTAVSFLEHCFGFVTGPAQTCRVSRYVCVGFSSLSVHTWGSDSLSDVLRVTKSWSSFFSFCLLVKVQPLQKRKEHMLAFGRTAGRGGLVPCLRYRLHNLVPVVWHRQMNGIQMCLELYANLKSWLGSPSLWSGTLLFRFCPHLCFLL